MNKYRHNSNKEVGVVRHQADHEADRDEEHRSYDVDSGLRNSRRIALVCSCSLHRSPVSLVLLGGRTIIAYFRLGARPSAWFNPVMFNEANIRDAEQEGDHVLRTEIKTEIKNIETRPTRTKTLVSRPIEIEFFWRTH